MERDLGDARLLFRGTGSVAWAFPAILACVLTFGVGVAVAQGSPLPAVLGFGALLSAELGIFAWVLRRYGWGAAAWVTRDALVFRLRRNRWLRIPWADVRGGTWIHTTQLNGPALMTTGDRDERPNPTNYALSCRPTLPEGWQSGARALQEEFEHRGIPWRAYPDDRRISELWTTTRWNW